jgi:hypothetical protein
MNLWNTKLLKRNNQESETLGGVDALDAQNEQDKLSSILEEHDSGVEQELTPGTGGLMTPENTLELEILVRWSIGDNNENTEQFNATSESVVERLSGKDRVQDPLAKDVLE